MGVLAEFDAVSNRLVLGQTLELLAGVDIEIERQFALDPAQPISFCWIQYQHIDRLERILERDVTITSFDRIGHSHDNHLYRIVRSERNVVDSYSQWISNGGALLESNGSNGRWTMRMRFPSRDALSTYLTFLGTKDVDTELHRLVENPSPDDCQSVLTAPQYEALSIAYENGYFAVPRETDLRTIATTLDISDQAVSERLRRAQARILEQTLY